MLGATRPLPVAEALHYLLQVALGLAHAADRGVVHRDIKPSNIIITPDGRAKLVDMGLARSPRPVRQGRDAIRRDAGHVRLHLARAGDGAARADVRSDIYSLGCTFYHVLTGQPCRKGRPPRSSTSSTRRRPTRAVCARPARRGGGHPRPDDGQGPEPSLSDAGTSRPSSVWLRGSSAPPATCPKECWRSRPHCPVRRQVGLCFSPLWPPSPCSHSSSSSVLFCAGTRIDSEPSTRFRAVAKQESDNPKTSPSATTALTEEKNPLELCAAPRSNSPHLQQREPNGGGASGLSAHPQFGAPKLFWSWTISSLAMESRILVVTNPKVTIRPRKPRQRATIRDQYRALTRQTFQATLTIKSKTCSIENICALCWIKPE